MNRYSAELLAIGLASMALLAVACGGSTPAVEPADLLAGDDTEGPAVDVRAEDGVQGDFTPGDTDLLVDATGEMLADGVGTDSGPQGCGGGGRKVFSVGVDEHCSAAGDNCWPNAWANSFPVAGAVKPTMTVGDCVFVRPPPLAWCDPACGPGTFCDEVTLTCEEYVPPVSAGIIEVGGLKSACVVTPDTQWYYYNSTFTPEPADGEIFDEGSTVVATAEGADVPPFSLSATGVANLDTSLTCPPPLQMGQSLTVSWTKSGVGNVTFFLGSGNHASQFSRIECQAAADKGQFVVDGSLITELLTDGAPIFRWTLTRASTSCEAAGDYDIVLAVTAGQSCMW